MTELIGRYKRPESVLVIVYTRDGKVLLLERLDVPGFWQSVTGAMAWDETDPRLTAVRELDEELGLKVAPAMLQDLGLTQNFPVLPQFRHRYAADVEQNVEHAFALELPAETAPVRHPEHSRYDWFTFDEAQRKTSSWTNRDAIRAVERRAAGSRRETVVLVHGWWMSGWWMTLLAWRLRRAGFDVRTYSYATVRMDLRENATRLHAFLGTLSADSVHLVGHSLGGIVIRALFHYFPQQRSGRIVTLGTPHQGSSAAATLARVPRGRELLGQSVIDVVSGAPRDWTLPTREIGCISGSRSFGIGRWIVSLSTPNDGTLTVAETSAADARGQLILPVTHTTMLTSRRVAQAVIQFLRRGSFG